MTTTAEVVRGALSRQLRIAPQQLSAREHEGLDRLGLDSHGLMRVLLDVERELKLSTSLELDDAALESPATLIAGISGIVGAP